MLLAGGSALVLSISKPLLRSFLSFLLRSLFDTCRDEPRVSRGVHNSPYAITPKLSLHGCKDRRPGGNRAFHRLVHVFNVDVDHNGRGAVGRRRTVRNGWKLSFD